MHRLTISLQKSLMTRRQTCYFVTAGTNEGIQVRCDGVNCTAALSPEVTEQRHDRVHFTSV